MSSPKPTAATTTTATPARFSSSPPAVALTRTDDITLANNVAEWLRRAQAATTRRDDAIARVARVAAAVDDSAADLEDCVHHVTHQQLPNLAPSVRTVAEAVSASARIAEGSYRKVTTIDRALTRVNEALDVTRAVLKMRASLTRMSEALNRGDIEAASAAVSEYDETSRKLHGRENLLMMHPHSNNHNQQQQLDDGTSSDTGTNPTSPSRGDSSDSSSLATGGGGAAGGRNNSNTSSSLSSSASTAADQQNAFVQETRQKVHEAAMAQLDKAVAALDEKAIRSCVTVLSRLSFVADAEKTFANFVAQKNKTELKAMVTKDLEAARTLRGASHLELVARLLDHTVGCLEEQQPFLDEVLGGRTRTVLLALHNQSAALCVEVLDDFLSQRKLHGGLQQQRGGGRGNNSNGGQQQQAATCDPVVVDQQLEDLARLMVCCSTYFNFLANKLQEEQAKEDKEQQATQQQDNNNGNNSSSKKENEKADKGRAREAQALVRKDNLLFDRVQDLLTIFVPLQIDYFDAACTVAIKDSLDALEKFEKDFLRRVVGAEGGNSSSSSNSKSAASEVAGFFAGVASALGANAEQLRFGGGSSSAADDSSIAASTTSLHHQIDDGSSQLQIPSVDAIDDIFFACRVAIHRVMGTRTAPIASPTLMVINNNVLRDKLLPLATSKATLSNNTHSNNTTAIGSNSALAAAASRLTPKAVLAIISALVWAGSLSSISSNSKHLAEEIGLLSEKFFDESADELMRFAAQRLDFVQTAAASEEALEQACKAIANEMFRLCGGACVEMRQVGFVEGGGGSTGAGAGSPARLGGADDGGFAIIDWVSGATDRFGAALSNVMLPFAPWPESVRCAVVSTFVDCVAVELEETLRRKRFDLAGALRLDRDLRLVRNYFSATDLDIAVREKFRRLTAMTTVLLAERKADAATAGSVLSQQEIAALLKQRVDPPTS